MDPLAALPGDLRRKIFDDLVRYPTYTEPYWIQVMGIPGAGKSELVRLLKAGLGFRKPHTLEATDEYLVQIPGFQEMKDKVLAFNTYDPIATEIGLAVHRQLIAQKSDVLFERSLASTNYRDLMYEVKKAGYRLITILVSVKTPIAKERTRLREAETGRHVPESVIDERVQLVQERWEEMKKIADYMVEVENNGEVSIYDAFKNTVKLVTDYVRKMKSG